MKSSKSLLIVSKNGHARAALLAEEMRSWLEGRGAGGQVMTSPTSGEASTAKLREAAEGKYAVLILGGDGTFIGVARHLTGMGIPLLGVNFGRVGFLAEVAASDWEPVLEDILQDRLRAVPRMLLDWTLRRGGSAVARGYAVNDIVIGRGALARVISLHIGFDSDAGEHEALGWLRADGVIVASPLGSSAYSLSAGGPLVYPDLNNLVLTAVAPLLGSIPPFVLPGDRCIRLLLDPDASAAADACLSVDGQEGYPLLPGDEVEVCGIADGVRILATAQGGYTHTLRSRGLVQLFSGQAAGGRGQPGSQHEG